MEGCWCGVYGGGCEEEDGSFLHVREEAITRVSLICVWLINTIKVIIGETLFKMVDVVNWAVYRGESLVCVFACGKRCERLNTLSGGRC